MKVSPHAMLGQRFNISDIGGEVNVSHLLSSVSEHAYPIREDQGCASMEQIEALASVLFVFEAGIKTLLNT